MKKPISKIMLAVQFIVAIPIMMLILFWPAGTLNWPEGWICLVLLLGYSSGLALYFLKHNPELVQKRMEMKVPPRLWDKLVMTPVILGMIALMIVPGLDVVRYEWSSIPVYWEVIGFLGFIISSYLIFLVMKVNSFLLKTVEIQEGQKVVSTGPYAYVRHPMYSASIIMVFSIALVLGSLYALIPAGISSFFFIVRTFLEDKTLQKELKGYTEYTKKVPYKLIPKLF